MKIRHLAWFAAVAALAGIGLRAQVIFSDDFNAGASSQWSNQIGAWTATGGVYRATAPNNFPPTYTSLPFNLSDFSLTVTVNSLSDGGIWLRSPNSNNGILLVTGGSGTTGTGLYWHEFQNGSYSSALNGVNGLFTNGVSSATITVTVIGNTFSAYVNGATTSATTLTSSLFSSGRVGLYSFSSQTFDNFSVSAIPEPPIATLLALGLLLGARWSRRS